MATFKGIITAALPIASGTSKNGKEWRRASYILTYDNSNPQYPKSVLFDVMGDRIEQLNIRQGQEYEVEIDFTTREFNGRNFMSASAWKATPVTQQTNPAPAPTPAPAQQGWQAVYPAPSAQPTQADKPKADDADNLPF